MKKLKLFLPALLLSSMLFSQAGQLNQINIVNFTVKNTLPGTIDTWISTPAALVLVAQKVPGARVLEPRLVLQIKSGSATICGTTVATARTLDPFDVRTFNTADLAGMLINCHELKEGTYTICAQFFNMDKIAISREVCKDFRVEATNVEYAPPTLITPENEKKFSPIQLEGPVMFRWTPLVPKPKEPVTYRLKVWQLMEGQTGTQAIRTNQPIVTKDVDNLTQVTVSGIYTGPCKPPYLCDFIWNVQALNRAGKPMGNNNGTSEPYTFGLAEEKSKGPTNQFPEDKKSLKSDQAKQPITFRWTPIVPKPKEPVTYRIKVWQLMQGQNGTQAMRSNAPIVTKDVDNVTEATVNGIYTGPCKPPYLCDFVWNVQVVTKDGSPGATSDPTTFNVTEETGKCSVNTLPEDKKEIRAADAKQAILFKWTNAATPGQASTYRIKVWQLMDGQNSTQAMRSNQPIVTKEVRNANEVSVSSIYTGPCKPPYLCDFIWAVEKMDASGRVTCTGEPTTFKVTEEAGKCAVNTLPEDKKEIRAADAKQAILFKWTNAATPGQAPTYRIKVWQLMAGQNGTQAMRSNQPIVTKEVRNANEISVNSIYTGPCKPPYLCDFIWAVEMMDASGHITCTSDPTTFRVTEEAGGKCAVNTLPEDKKELRSADAKQAILFKWTNAATPGQASTYRIKVWQLMDGQNSTQAMRSNQPIVTKEIRNANEISVNSIYTGPCKPPYLCDFIWAVEMMDASGHVTCTTEPTTFKVTDESGKCPANTLPEDKKELRAADAKKEITFKWTNTATPGQAPAYRIKVWQLMAGQNGTQAMRSNQPVVTKEVRNANEISINSIYTGPCKPPYLCDFIWAVEMMDASGHVTCTGEPTTFKVTEETGKCPVNTLPENKKELRAADAKKGITFRFRNDALAEYPKYRIKVWQLMQGQNSTEAMRTNKPIVIKEVSNITEAQIEGIYTGPCKPPYLCDFIWAVEMIDATGHVTCTSEPTTFKIANNDIDIQIDSLDVSCCKDGKQNIYLKLKNNLATPVKITQIKIDKVNGVTANIIPSPLTPSLFVIIPGNGTQIFTGQINCIDTAKIIRIWVAAEDPTDNAITETEVEADTLHCRCDACDEKNFILKAPAPGQISTTNNSLSFNQSITVTTTPPGKPIKTITAELVYFEMVPENDQCIPCDKDAGLYGHFASGTNSQQWTWPQTSLSISITTPVTPCCSTLFRWCIRYKIEFKDCTVCSKVICYEKKKAGCTPTGGGTGTDNPNHNPPK